MYTRNMNKNLTFPTTVGNVIDNLTGQGYDAHDVLCATTIITGTAYQGQKITQTAYKKIIAFLDGADRPFVEMV